MRILLLLLALAAPAGAQQVLPEDVKDPSMLRNLEFLYDELSVLRSSASATASSVRSGSLTQMSFCAFTSTGTSVTVIQDDDTIPQNTEGVQLFTCSITPRSATSTLVIQATVNIAAGVNNTVYGCIFQDSTANALACGEFGTIGGGAVGSGGYIVIPYSKVSGTTSAITFKFRAGGYSAGGGNTWGWNVKGLDGASTLGFTRTSAMVISELAP